MEIHYHVFYNLNGADYGIPPVDEGEYETGAEAITLDGFGQILKEGYIFQCWNTEADGSGDSYFSGDIIPVIDADKMLYAQWAIGMASDLIKESLDNLLEAKASGRFVIVGSRNQSTSAETVETLPQVTTYYDSGDFPKSSSTNGPYTHEITMKIDILVAASSPVDLAVLNDPAATPEDLASALAANATAAVTADRIFDRTKSVIWGIIMSPQNSKLGIGESCCRWITGIRKNAPAPRGCLVLLSGTLIMTASVLEYPDTEYEVEDEEEEEIDNLISLTADVVGNELDIADQGVKVGFV